MDTFFSIASADIIYEVVDDEVIIINLKKGIYYSLNGAGVDVWALLIKSINQRQVVSSLTNKYTAAEGEIEQAINKLFEQFESEELIKPVLEHSSLIDSLGEVESIEEIIKKPFITPILESYSELQEMLLLDPIHDVDRLGWPVTEPVS